MSGLKLALLMTIATSMASLVALLLQQRRTHQLALALRQDDAAMPTHPSTSTAAPQEHWLAERTEQRSFQSLLQRIDTLTAAYQERINHIGGALDTRQQRVDALLSKARPRQLIEQARTDLERLKSFHQLLEFLTHNLNERHQVISMQCSLIETFCALPHPQPPPLNHLTNRDAVNRTLASLQNLQQDLWTMAQNVRQEHNTFKSSHNPDWDSSTFVKNHLLRIDHAYNKLSECLEEKSDTIQQAIDHIETDLLMHTNPNQNEVYLDPDALNEAQRHLHRAVPIDDLRAHVMSPAALLMFAPELEHLEKAENDKRYTADTIGRLEMLASNWRRTTPH